MNKIHKVYIVGSGPGDINLLTMKAHQLITCYAEVIIHDRLISEDILNLIPPQVERIFAGKEPKFHHMKQDEINTLLVEKARAGKKVVRLKGGDPFIFGRGGEEAEILSENNIPFEIVPGISAAIGAAAQFNLPLTYRNLSDGLIILTGHNCKDEEPKLDYEFLARTDNLIALYMAVNNIEKIVERLLEHGKSSETPCLAISNATTSSSHNIYSPLVSLPQKMNESALKNPCIVYIGNVVKISQALCNS